MTTLQDNEPASRSVLISSSPVLLLALVLTDAGRPKEALEILARPGAQRAPPVERLLAEGYAWRKAGDHFKAISVYTDALKLAPANQEARSAAAAGERHSICPS